MDSALPKPSIMGASQRFSVNRHNAFNQARNLANPIREELLKAIGRQNRKHTPEGVMRGDAIRQFKKTLEPVLPNAAKPQPKRYQALGVSL